MLYLKDFASFCLNDGTRDRFLHQAGTGNISISFLPANLPIPSKVIIQALYQYTIIVIIFHLSLKYVK